MRTRPLAVALLLLLGASALVAQRRIERIDAIEVMVAANTACGAAQENHIFVIVDASSSSDCDSTGGGSTNALCMCDGGTMKAVAGSASIADYVPITKAGQQSITATGAGNDVTLVAADDVLLTPADDFVVTPTAGSVALNAVGAGEDITLTAADDVILAPTDALTATVGGAVAVTTTDGAVGITAQGAGNDITLTAADDVILAPTDALTITAASGTIAATTTFAIDAAGGTDELGIAEGLVGLMGLNIYGAFTGPTALGVTCDAGAAGDLYYDTETDLEFCFCNGTNWVKFSDASTQCGDPA